MFALDVCRGECERRLAFFWDARPLLRAGGWISGAYPLDLELSVLEAEMKNVTRRKERMSLRSGWGAWIEEEGEEGGLGGWDERCPQKPVFYTFRGPHLAGNPHAERGKQKHRTSLVDWLLSRSNVMLARCGACPERVSAPASVAPNGKHDKNELPDGLASTTCRATSTNLPVTVGAHVKDSMRPDTFTCACKARFTVDTSGKASRGYQETQDREGSDNM